MKWVFRYILIAVNIAICLIEYAIVIPLIGLFALLTCCDQTNRVLNTWIDTLRIGRNHV